MTIEFNFIDSHEGIWFSYRKSKVELGNDGTERTVWEEPVEDAKFLIRSIEPFIEEKLKKEDLNRKTEFVPNKITKEMQRVSYVPEKTFEERLKETEEMYIWSILDWEGIGTKGELLQVSIENKRQLSRNSEFCRFFDRCQRELKEEASSYKEESEKN